MKVVEGWLLCGSVTLVMFACGDDEDANVADMETSGTSSGQPGTSDSAVEAGPDVGPDSSGDSEEVPDCVTDEDCPEPTAPACVGGLCLSCDHALEPDGRCFAADESRPLCGPEGACVQCTAANPNACPETTPLCDVATSSCIGCTTHEDCPGTACDKETGACFSDECVLHVDSEGKGDHETITAALGSSPFEDCVLVVHRSPNDIPYYESVQVHEQRRIAILGEGIGRPRLDSVGFPAGVSADNDAVVYVSGMELLTGEILVKTATVSIDTTDIVTTGAAIRATSQASRVVLENSWVNGSNGSPEGAIVLEGGELEASFVTVTGYDRALQCASRASAVVRNSVLLSWSDEAAIECTTLEATYSAFEVSFAGHGNQSVGPLQPEWFVTVDGLDRLSTTPPPLLGVTARWTTGDPAEDIDGDNRPDRDGTMHWAGADVPE